MNFLSLKGIRLIHLLKKDRILPEWKGKLCPKCGKGVLGKLEYRKDRSQWVHRCGAKKCQARIRIEDFHPIFYAGAGNSTTSLSTQAAILFCAVAGVPRNATHLVLDVDHKAVERLYANNDIARARYVQKKEKSITYGGTQKWKVEADEVDLGKGEDPDAVRADRVVKWEQWGGLVERGRPSSLRLFKLKPRLTKKRAPGPGPIRKREWLPIGRKFLSNKHVVLHTDGAKAYKVKLPNVAHCNVVHQKKKSSCKARSSGSNPTIRRSMT